MRAALLLIAALTAAAGPALAGTPVRLKADTVSATSVVTLGDLFDDAGAAAGVAIGTRTGSAAVLSAPAVQMLARRAGLDWANAEGLKTIVVRGGEPRAQGVSSAARGNRDVLTYARSISAGEMIQPEDLVWGKAAAAPSDAPTDADQVIGKVAKRPLREGAVVASRDVGTPQVVKAGETITVVYASEGISLSLQGRAMTSGGVGDTVNVLNTSSKKTIQAVVTGPGEAVVGPAADSLKAIAPARYALR